MVTLDTRESQFESHNPSIEYFSANYVAIKREKIMKKKPGLGYTKMFENKLAFIVQITDLL